MAFSIRAIQRKVKRAFDSVMSNLEDITSSEDSPEPSNIT